MKYINLISKEKVLLRYLIREFHELNNLLLEAKKADKTVDIHLAIKTLLKKMRGGLFSGEERIEYRLARQYQQCRDVFNRYRTLMSEIDFHELKEILDEASLYNAALEKLGARGGDIEKALLEKDLNLPRIEDLLAQALEADRAFEVIVHKLIQKTQKTSLTKSRMNVVGSLGDLAIVESINPQYHYLTLFNVSAFVQIMRESKQTFEEFQVGNEAKFRKRLAQEEQITEMTDDDGDFRKLNFNEVQILNKSVVGFCQLFRSQGEEYYLGALELFRIAAKKGYGPFLFEMAFALAAKRNHPVVIDRKDVTEEARKVLEFFDLHRPDVLKYPASLVKYPKLIGFTEEMAMTKFGTKGVYYSSGFDGFGLPDGTSEEFKKRIIPRIILYNKSQNYREREGCTNLVIGGTASLDKAYYCDRDLKLYNQLIAHGKGLGADYIHQKGVEQLLRAAGVAFFQRSRTR